MNWFSSELFLLRITIFILLATYHEIVSSQHQAAVTMYETTSSSSLRLIVSSSHTALSGDLQVFLLKSIGGEREKEAGAIKQDTRTSTTPFSSSSSSPFRLTTLPTITDNKIINHDSFILRVMRLDGFTSELIGEVSPRLVETNSSSSSIQLNSGNISFTIPCGFFSRGGAYLLQLEHDADNKNSNMIKTWLDVPWPIPSISVEPQHFNTYPDQPVLVTIEYPGISCFPSAGQPVETWSLQLIYCGASVLSCDPARNKSSIQLLYSDEIVGFPSRKILQFRCEFFGLAGHYALRLEPSHDNSTAPTTSTYIKVELSNQYIFNVHARSVYPCDGHINPGGVGSSSGSRGAGLSVLFEYPACRLEGDRVRVYGRLRADVASLAPPTTLHYISELKAPPGKHTLTFDCEIFTEKFIEYCFAYVSQAINHAMAQVRVDCIPTFPLLEMDSGGWGAWSSWSSCSSTCIHGVRNRYRFCDNPPPRYGAKFCQGQAVETESCGLVGRDHHYHGNILNLQNNLTRPDWACYHGSKFEIEKPDQDKPESGKPCRCGCLIKLTRESPQRILTASTQACPGRSFWLIQAAVNNNKNYVIKFMFNQIQLPCIGQHVKVRDGDSLGGKLLAHIALDHHDNADDHNIISNQENLLVEFFSDEISAAKPSCLGGFLAHAIIFSTSQMENITCLTPTSSPAPPPPPPGTSIFLDSNIIFKPWTFPAHLVAALLLVLMFIISIFLVLQYTIKYRKYRVAQDLDTLTDDSSYCYGGEDRDGPSARNHRSTPRRTRTISTSTLISEIVSFIGLSRRNSLSLKTGMTTKKHDRLQETTVSHGNSSSSIPDSLEHDPNDHSEIINHVIAAASNIEQQQQYDSNCDSIVLETKMDQQYDDYHEEKKKKKKKKIYHEITNFSANSSTIAQQSPQAKIKYARPVKLETFSLTKTNNSQSVSASAVEGACSINHEFSPGTISNSSTSSSSSNTNTMTISSTLHRGACRGNKETKDRKNRERLLQGSVLAAAAAAGVTGGSEFSLNNPDTDLELDYYDYNVVNAGAAPGSYLGMDPAFLVWIPPLEPGESDIFDHDYHDTTTTTTTAMKIEHEYEEIMGARKLNPNVQDLSLSPNEYNNMIKHKYDDETMNTKTSTPKKFDPGKNKLYNQVISEYRARLDQKESSSPQLPIQKLSRSPHLQSCNIIPNRLETKEHDHDYKDHERISSPADIRSRIQKNIDQDHDHHDLTAFNSINNKKEMIKCRRTAISTHSTPPPEDIPLKELGHHPKQESSLSSPPSSWSSPVRVHDYKLKEAKHVYISSSCSSSQKVPCSSPDHGVELDLKEIAKELKFADDDHDHDNDQDYIYMDNRVM